MKYVIMAAGKGTRWNDYLGVPKHLVEINGETLLGRTTRLLKENGINDYVITSEDSRYAQYGPIAAQTSNDCEIDRFEESLVQDSVCYLYGDVYYTEEAIKTIINTDTKDIQYFGSKYEIFAIKINQSFIQSFFNIKNIIKQKYLSGEINRCIGWETYRYLHNIPFDEHIITDHYTYILDGTDDIDYPDDYENFKQRMEEMNND